jgi:hypothetical protein
VAVTRPKNLKPIIPYRYSELYITFAFKFDMMSSTIFKCITGFFVLVWLLYSCKSKDAHSPAVAYPGSETLEIYAATNDGKGYAQDSLLYKEVTTYKAGKKSTITYYDKNLSIKGIEHVKYDANGVESGLDYVDNNAQLMSYYKHTTDQKGLKVSSTAFEGKTHEVLRIEQYQYDDNNKLKIKDLLSSELVIQRRYNYNNDAQGDVVGMTIQDAKGDTIAVEHYKITKYDDQKRWIEKWGFINDAPKTMHRRTFSQK